MVRTIIVTPAGRKQYLQKLLNHLLLQRDHFDEWHLWNNCQGENEENLSKLEQEYDFIKVIHNSSLPRRKPHNFNVCRFYQYAKDTGTIYIKLDDDIVWMEPDFIKKLVQFRIENPEPFLVFGNVINNQIVNYIHQCGGLLQDLEILDYHCYGNLHRSKANCIKLHKEFLESRKAGNLDDWKFDRWELKDFEVCCINCVAWFGEKISIPRIKDELYFSHSVPKRRNTPNVIFGSAICVHLSYWKQRSPELEAMLDDISSV